LVLVHPLKNFAGICGDWGSSLSAFAVMTCWHPSTKWLCVAIIFLIGELVLGFQLSGRSYRATKNGVYLQSTKESKVVLGEAADLQTAEPVQTSTTKDVLNLDTIRKSLIRQEETIIFAMIERAQYAMNPTIYSDEEFDLESKNPRKAGLLAPRKGTFLEYLLCEREKVDASVRRYTSPEEYPFFPDYIPEPMLPPLDLGDPIMADHNCSLNEKILKSYKELVLPRICAPGDDGHHGSAATLDVNALQALSKRVHNGLFVAESKYCDKPEQYEALCAAGDTEGVYELLTNRTVEAKVLQRAEMKAETYGQDPSAPKGEQPEYKVRPSVIRGLYEHVIIPLTKEVEVMYLYKRCGFPIPEDVAERLSKFSPDQTSQKERETSPPSL